MKIGFYTESSADQAALAVFAEGIIGGPPEPIHMSLEAHGVIDVLRGLDGVFRGVYYRTDAEGFVVVVDCDDSELHDSTHDASGRSHENRRFCLVGETLAQTRKTLRPVAGRRPIKVAVGLAVPAIEAWYLVGREHQVGEAAWRVGLDAGRPPFTRPKLKELVYGTSIPSVERATECAVKEARRIIGNLKAIEDAFPVGFGLMAKAIRSWAASSQI
jgi:hypothetical protein